MEANQHNEGTFLLSITSKVLFTWDLIDENKVVNTKILGQPRKTGCLKELTQQQTAVMRKRTKTGYMLTDNRRVCQEGKE